MKRQLIKTGITVTLPIVILIVLFALQDTFIRLGLHPNEPDAKRNDGSKHSR